MGEYADDHLGYMFDEMEDRERDPFRDDFDDGPFPWRGNRRWKPQVKTCNRCGEGGLIWTDDEGEWRLMDPSTYKLHTCGRGADLSAFKPVAE